MLNTLTAYVAAHMSAWYSTTLAPRLGEGPGPDIDIGNAPVDGDVDRMMGKLEATVLRIAAGVFVILAIMALVRSARGKKEQGGLIFLAIIGVVVAYDPNWAFGKVADFLTWLGD